MLHSTAASRLATVVRHLAAPRVRIAALPSYRQSAPLARLASACIHSAPCASSGFGTLARNAPLLPPQSSRDAGRLTVVLDMDETLLHSHLVRHGLDTDPRSADDHKDERAAHIADPKPADFTFDIGDAQSGREKVTSVLRPGVIEFLHALSADFEPILFTSAMEIYASPLLDRIDATSGPNATPEALRPLWRHRVYRPGTVNLGPFSFVKDVSRLGRDMSRVVLIDNSWQACVANPDNCIVVPDYLGEKEDPTLVNVLKMLRAIKDEKDVRPSLIRMVRYREQIEAAGVKLPTK